MPTVQLPHRHQIQGCDKNPQPSSEGQMEMGASTTFNASRRSAVPVETPSQTQPAGHQAVFARERRREYAALAFERSRP